MSERNLDRNLTAQRLVGVFVLGWLLFDMPILALFDTGGSVLGIPSLYAYLFGAWALLVLLLAWLSGGTGRGLASEPRD